MLSTGSEVCTVPYRFESRLRHCRGQKIYRIVLISAEYPAPFEYGDHSDNFLAPRRDGAANTLTLELVADVNAAFLCRSILC